MDTSFIEGLNWPAVLVAALAYFILGALWYSKLLFANQWIASSGVDMNKPGNRKGVGGIMAFTFLLELVVCIGLGILVYRLMLAGFLSGIKLGVFTGICFAAIGITISYLYQSKPQVLTFIDTGYHITGNILAAVILCVWQ